MKLSTIIAQLKLSTIKIYYIYYNTNMTKQLKFLKCHFSIVCCYCSVLCLMAKNNLKMIKFSSSFKLNEIYTADSPFNEDPKTILFFQGGHNFRGWMAGKFRQNGQ